MNPTQFLYWKEKVFGPDIYFRVDSEANNKELSLFFLLDTLYALDLA